MAQTKRKRRNKHRGNAVGMVEARGRTSKPQAGATANGKGAARGGARGAGRQAALKPPTLRGSATKALIGAALLFVFFRFLSKGTSTAQALTMCVIAVVLYTPIMFMTDRWIYNRKTKQQAQGGARAR